MNRKKGSLQEYTERRKGILKCTFYFYTKLVVFYHDNSQWDRTLFCFVVARPELLSTGGHNTLSFSTCLSLQGCTFDSNAEVVKKYIYNSYS